MTELNIPEQQELSDYEIRAYISTLQKGVVKLSIACILLFFFIVFLALNILEVF